MKISESPDPDIARMLAITMSEISEEHWCAGWMVNLEFSLWEMVQGGVGRRYGMGEVTESEVADLKRLSERCGGWIYYGEDGREFAPLAYWELLYRAYKESQLP